VLSPVLKKLTGPETEYDLMTVDVDKHPELAGEFKVRLGMPMGCGCGWVARVAMGRREVAAVGLVGGGQARHR
jgi:hypothetical protein